MDLKKAGALRFQEVCMPRVWGGRRLESLYGKILPPDQPVGEMWLVSDHPVHESVVAEGMLKGKSIRDLMQEDPEFLLGTIAKPTANGRFPLLLKLLDAKENLSVQVHPDDACAEMLGEPDGGKTEMWYVLEASAGSKLYCGLKNIQDENRLREILGGGKIMEHLESFAAEKDQALLLPAGQVHAIGRGVLLAEIQQNSDLTYRIYDWGRMGMDGTPRELHLEKAAKAIHLNEPAPKVIHAGQNNLEQENLCECAYFAARRFRIQDALQLNTQQQSPHIVLVIEGDIEIKTNQNSLALKNGEAALIPAGVEEYILKGKGVVLAYFVPG